MSKAVLISIKPKWCELIASGKKTIEVRKNHPKIDTPFKCYIYCTLAGSNEFFHETLKGDVARWNRERWWEKKGNVIGEFICDKIGDYVEGFSFNSERTCISLKIQACLSQKEVWNYSGGKDLYGWHISNLKMYDKPKELSIFHKPVLPLGLRYEDDAIKRPPQSWCYIEELKGGD